MAGFERPREPGAVEPGTTKLPSWASTRSDPEPDVGGSHTTGRSGIADLGGGNEGTRSPRPEPPVSRVPEHPFDVTDPFGDKQLGGVSSPWIRPPADDTEVRVVDLADEFHLTTVQALEVCEAAGSPANSGAAWLTLEQAAAFRAAVVRYDRSATSGESYPDWAIPPGGVPSDPRRPAGPAVAGAPPAPPTDPSTTPSAGAATSAATTASGGTAPVSAASTIDPPAHRSNATRIVVALVVLAVALVAVAVVAGVLAR